MKTAVSFLALFLIVGCGHKMSPKVTVPPAGPPEHAIAFETGVKAFREGTPEGYTRAVDSFRKATRLSPRNCDYVLHLSEALFFLAQQQKLNWEDYAPQASEADTIVVFKEGAPECAGFEGYLTRLKALGMTFTSVRIADVVAVINRAIELEPHEAMNFVVLSQLRPQASGNALAPIQRAAELAPDLPTVQYELGNYYLTNQATYPEARQAFERALQLNPRHFHSIIGIVYSLSLAGEEDVEPLLKRAVEIAPTSLKARTLLGDYYAGLEETESAEEQYRAAIEMNARYYPAHMALGTTLMTAERHNDAERAFDAVVELDVKTARPPMNGVDLGADAGAHYYLGNIWLERNDLAKAKTEYLKSVSSLPDYAPAIYGIGTVLHREGQVDEALAQLERVIQLDARRFPNAFLARGGIRAERRQFQEALKDLERAIEIYRQQIATQEAKIQLDESKGWKRKAEGEKKRKALIEYALQKALETKKLVEAQIG
jgi:tetratricopeptide (TPR) repeat protein